MLKKDKKRETKVSIFQNLSNEKEYKACTGLSHEEFNKLFDLFDKLYIPKKGSGLKNLYKPLFTDKKEALFFILYYLKTYVTYQVLAFNFGITEGSAHSYIKTLKSVLKQVLSNYSYQPVRLFESQEAFDNFFKDIEIDIDVTENKAQRNTDNELQKDNYSGKKKTIQENG